MLNKEDLIQELAKLETMNWAKDKKIAESIFPYVLVETINLLKNSKEIDNPVDYFPTGKKANKNINAIALGKLGGQATKRKHGKKHYQKLAENMNKKRWGKGKI